MPGQINHTHKFIKENIRKILQLKKNNNDKFFDLENDEYMRIYHLGSLCNSPCLEAACVITQFFGDFHKIKLRLVFPNGNCRKWHVLL